MNVRVLLAALTAAMAVEATGCTSAQRDVSPSSASIRPGQRPVEYHVATTGNDANVGTAAAPFLTIGRAAELAQPGDTVTVYGGMYRDHVKPARGGLPGKPIVYRAAPGERVDVRGSEIIGNWTREASGTWKVALDPALVSSYNPFVTFMDKDNARLGDKSRPYSCGDVFLDGVPLTEVNTPADVADKPHTWAPSVDGLTLYANFGEADPGRAMVEVSVRQQIFAPTAWNLGYIVVRGFVFSHAANNYAGQGNLPNSEPRRGAVSTNGGHDWVIEDCFVNYPRSIGIDWGLVGVQTVTANGVPQRYGHHVIRRNVVRGAGTTGMTAYRGAFTEVSANAILHANRLGVGGYGNAGIRCLDQCVDLVFVGNYFYRCKGQCLGLDWALQNVRIRGNIFAQSGRLILEATHGPNLVDSNVFFKTSLETIDVSGTVFAHNLFAESGSLIMTLLGQRRNVQCWQPNSVTLVRREPTHRRNNRFLNNIFFFKSPFGLPNDDEHTTGNLSDWNVWSFGANPTRTDAHSVTASTDTIFTFQADEKGAALSFSIDDSPRRVHCKPVDASTVGRLNPVVSQDIQAADADFFGKPFGPRPPAGPFTDVAAGRNRYTLFTVPAEPGVRKQ